jgi:DNA-binding response OmpR family regulator
MRVLVAEDERITRASLARQLEAWGHVVTIAEDGQQACDHFHAGRFDLVLTDWDMPRMSELQLILSIREIRDAEFVYIIMLTAPKVATSTSPAPATPRCCSSGAMRSSNSRTPAGSRSG